VKKITVRNIFAHEDTIYLVGRYMGQGIVAYSIGMERFFEYKCKFVEQNENQVWNPFMNEGVLTLIPQCTDLKIISFDMGTNKFSFHSSISEMDESLKESKIMYPMSDGNICTFGGKNGDVIVKYDLRLRNIVISQQKGGKIRSCLPDDNGLWIVTEDGSIIFEQAGSYQSIAQKICGETAWILSGEQFICILMQEKSKVALINRQRFAVREIGLPFDDYDLMKKRGSSFVNCFETDLFFYLVPYTADNLYRISKKDFHAEKILLQIEEAMAHALLKSPITENRVFGLHDYIEIIK